MELEKYFNQWNKKERIFLSLLNHVISRGDDVTEAINRLAYLYSDFDESKLNNYSFQSTKIVLALSGKQ